MPSQTQPLPNQTPTQNLSTLSYSNQQNAQNPLLNNTQIHFGLSENQPTSQLNYSKTWPDIGGVKAKQAREVIEIMEEKSSAQQIVSLQNGSALQNSKLDEKLYYMVEMRPKEDYWNKESIHENELYLRDSIEQEQNYKIYQRQMQSLFPDKDQNSPQHKQVALQSISFLLSNPQTQNFNILKLVDLLYKKYVLLPVKEPHSDKAKQDLFKPSPVRAQKYYLLNDPSLADTPTQLSQNPFKRNAPVNGHSDSGIALIDNDSTNQTGDFYDNMGSKYINGQRKQFFKQPQQKNQFLSKPSPDDRFKKPVNSRPEIPLPFDIQIPQQAVRKQFNPGYNLFQGPDDQKNQRFEEERVIAKTFVKDGYGLQIVRNYMPHVDGGTYNRAITTIIRESYKKIEDFLLKQCNIKIHALTSSQFSLVKTPLVHCRNILCDEDRSTFFKYIAITYKFGKLREDIFPTAEQTLRLYKAIVRGLNDRKAAKEMNPKPSKQKDMYFSR